MIIEARIEIQLDRWYRNLRDSRKFDVVSAQGRTAIETGYLDVRKINNAQPSL